MTRFQSLPALDGQLNASATAAMTWLVAALGIVTILSILFLLRRRMQRNKKKSRRATGSSGVAESRDHHHQRHPHHHYPSSGKLTGNALLPAAGEMPVCLTKNVLHQERFTNNPEYDWNADQGSTGSGADTSQLLQASGNDQFKPFVIIRPEWIELKQEIGEGCFGKVFRGSLRRPSAPNQQEEQEGEEEENHFDDEAVAVKVLKAAAGPAAQEDLLQEAEIMVSFSHPNILSLKGIVINGKTDKSSLFTPSNCPNFPPFHPSENKFLLT